MSCPFIPKPGQVDYTHIRYAPVINCVVRCKEKILLVKRGKDLSFYPNVWNGISGFLDDDKDLDSKVREELREELGIDEAHIKSIYLGTIFHREAPEHNKTWIVHSVWVEVDTDTIRLDWESSEYRWIFPEEVKNFELMPGFEKVLEGMEEIFL